MADEDQNLCGACGLPCPEARVYCCGVNDYVLFPEAEFRFDKVLRQIVNEAGCSSAGYPKCVHVVGELEDHSEWPLLCTYVPGGCRVCADCAAHWVTSGNREKLLAAFQRAFDHLAKLSALEAESYARMVELARGAK